MDSQVNMAALWAAKKALRLDLKRRVAALSEAEKRRQTAAVSRRLLAHPKYQNCQRVAVFLSLSDEIQTEDIIKDVFQCGKQCFIPRYKTKSNHMDMVKLSSAEEIRDLPLTSWNIHQPAEDVLLEEALTTGKKVTFDVERGTKNHVTKPTESILFDKVNVNIKKAYNIKTGKFITPVNGVYFFSFSSLPYRGVATDVVLMNNGNIVRNIHSVLACYSSHLAVQNAILKLGKGDSVWVKLENGKLWSRDGSISFLGFLISPM